MKRREFVTKAAVVSGAAAAAAIPGCSKPEGSGSGVGAPAVSTRKKIRWRLASSFPSGLDTIYGSAEVLASRIAAMTGGDFQVRAHQAGEIVPGLQVLDAVQQGTVPVGQTASYY